MLKPRTFLLILLLLLSFTWLFSSGLWKRAKTHGPAESSVPIKSAELFLKKMQLKADDAKSFAQQKGFNQTICFMVDMSLPSGRDRLFVYDLIKDTIRNAGLVTHGRCNQYWLDGRKYGNTIGCGCTSLGKYKIGHSYQGRFGLAYKLHGLDKTNNKAFERFVVLHSHECVPATEVKEEICQSDGCPTVSPGFLQYLRPIIDASKKPVLLWIYE
jgi:L,D-transpeptidase catalytic domain